MTVIVQNVRIAGSTGSCRMLHAFLWFEKWQRLGCAHTQYFIHSFIHTKMLERVNL